MKRTTLKARWELLLLTALMVATIASGPGTSALAQSTNSGDIRGTVTDASGALLPDVNVTVTNTGTGVTKNLVTNKDGIYDTNSIVAGTYSVSFTKDGFTKLERPSITLQVGMTTINGQLTLGSVNQEVVVNTDVSLLETDTAALSTTLSASTLSQLPQVGQNWENFTILLPGASGAPGGAQGSANPGQTASINGNLPYSNILADGASTTLPSSANADPAVLETVQELQVSTSAFSAQYGVGGIMMNQITKGGTNQFHGAVYEYWQNDDMNAAPYSFTSAGSKRPKTPYLRYNNFGGAVGGPLLRKKLFFFFDYDRLQQNGGASNVTTSVPTTALLNGDFSGSSVTIYDPATTRIIQQTGTYTYFPNGGTTGVTQTCPCYTRDPFPGNKIPSSRIDPVAKNIQAYYPAPNSGATITNGISSNNFSYNTPNPNKIIRIFGRADYDITPHNRLTMSDTEGDNPGFNSNEGICPVNCQAFDISRNNAQITDVWTISPRLINEARLGYTNQLNFFVPSSLGLGLPAKLGLQYSKADVFPNINVNGFDSLQPATNAVYKEHGYDPSDVVTFITGKHILHFGGEFLFFRDNTTAWGNLRSSQLTFTGAYTAQAPGISGTGQPYADFLLGQVQSWNARNTPESGARMRLPQMFIQDDYKIRQNVTLNLGLRYQIQSGWGEVKGNMRAFDPTLPNPASGNLGAMWYGSTKAGGRSTLQAPVYNTLLPRVGVAWQVQPKLNVRAGFGLYAYNWSLDTYGQGMGDAFGAQGSLSDQSNGVAPVLLLSGPGTNLPFVVSTTDPSAFNGGNVTYNQYHTPVGGTYQWNLSAQRELGTNMVMQMAYVASHGHDLQYNVDVNQVPVGKLAQSDKQFRPYPQYGGIGGSGTHNAISNYNSLQTSIQKRMTHGLSMDFSYTWAHFMDDIDSSGWGSRAGAQDYQNSYDPASNYGASNFDVRNALKGSYVYQLPFGRGRQFLNHNALIDTVIGGWQTSGTIVVQSGQPFTVVMANGSNSYALAGSWYPNVVGDPHQGGHRGAHGTDQWFNEAAFAVPTSGTFGNSRRNSINGPGLTEWNSSVGKTFAIWEQVRLQVHVDATNVLNHPSFGLPNRNIVTAGGATSTGTSTIRSVTVGGRSLQAAARLSF